MKKVRVLLGTWLYDVLVVAGVVLIAVGLWLVSPTPALIWLGTSLLFVARYGRE